MVSSREETRELRIVVRDMTYYVNGSNEPNPALQFTPGEQIRLSLRNDDRGMNHDVRIPDWGVGTKVIGWSEEQSITFRVPSNKSGGKYVCTPHSEMMSGKIVVQ